LVKFPSRIVLAVPPRRNAAKLKLFPQKSVFTGFFQSVPRHADSAPSEMVN
jgi:hypothetical protein